jgi:CRISPR-associated endonuclease/helicase Cas3
MDDQQCPSFGPAAHVYDEHILLRSWLALRNCTQLALPADIDRLVQQVYDGREDPPPGLTEGVQRQWRHTLHRQRAAKDAAQAEAQVRWLPPPRSGALLAEVTRSPLDEDAPDIHPAHQALTRLAEPSVSVVLLHATHGGIAMTRDGICLVDLSRYPSAIEAAQLLGRSVTISDRRLVRALQAEPVPPAWQRSPLLRHHRVMVLGEGGAVQVGHHRLRLDTELGVVIDTEEP